MRHSIFLSSLNRMQFFCAISSISNETRSKLLQNLLIKEICEISKVFEWVTQWCIFFLLSSPQNIVTSVFLAYEFAIFRIVDNKFFLGEKIDLISFWLVSGQIFERIVCIRMVFLWWFRVYQIVSKTDSALQYIKQKLAEKLKNG